MDSKVRTYQFALKIINFIDKLQNDMSTQIIAKQLFNVCDINHIFIDLAIFFHIHNKVSFRFHQAHIELIKMVK